MSTCGEVLVAIMNNGRDLHLASEQHWYRIPVHSVERFLKDRWPPRLLAFYQTQVFGTEAYAINYYAQVTSIREVCRRQLFPNEPSSPISDKRYYQLFLSPLERLPRPILSRRWRRILFIPTTEDKLFHATEINDLFVESTLEENLWGEFQRLGIRAERQERVKANRRTYVLDFAIYCLKGSIDVETDGDYYHANPHKAAQDNVRNNDLESVGWNVLRFTSRQIQEQMSEYCLPSIASTIKYLGQQDEGTLVPSRIDLDGQGGGRQLALLDHGRPGYALENAGGDDDHQPEGSA